MLVLAITFTWRRVAVLLLLLGAIIAMFIFAPSRVYVHSAIGPLAQRDSDRVDLVSFFPKVNASQVNATKIADISGSLWEWTGVTTELFYIRSGAAVGDRCRVGMGTSSSRLDHPFGRYLMSR
jgi:hypothetical protein